MKTIYAKKHFTTMVNFTGCITDFNYHRIIFYKNGKIHRKGKPAIIYRNGTYHYCINDLAHREDGPSSELANGYRNWCYKDKCYGHNNDFTIKSWIKKVKELKREEQLKIFI